MTETNNFDGYNVTSNDQIRDGRDTPCVGVCNTLYVDICQGCGRTATEEFSWSILSDEEKDAVWDRILKQGWKPGVGVNSQRKT